MPHPPNTTTPNTNSGNTENNEGNSDNTGGTQTTLSERTDVRNWTGDVDSLSLSSSGLTFKAPAENVQDALAGQNSQSTSSDPSLTDELSLTTEPEAPATQQLPEQLDATLNLSFNLDASKWTANPENTRASVIANDTFTVALPEGISSSAEGQEFEVYQRDVEGNVTSIKIATAKVENGTLTVTFISPVDTEIGETYLVGASSEGASTLSILRGNITLDVKVNSSLAGADAQDISWVLQTSADGREQTATLHIPSIAELADLLGLPDPAEQNNNAIASTNSVSTLADDDGNTTYSLSNYSGTLSMGITWCDNNYSERPLIAEWTPNFIPQFSVDGGTTYIDLIGTDGQLTAEARAALHIEEDDPSWVRQASVIQSSVSNWDISFSGLPTTLNTTVAERQLDDDGQPAFDASGQPLYTYKTTQTSISWRLQDRNTCPDDYMYGRNDKGNTSNGSEYLQRYLMRTQEYTFTIQGKLGNQTLKDVFGENFAGEHSGDFLFSALINNSSEWGGEEIPSTTLTAMATDPANTFDIVFSEDGNTATITATLPMYTQENLPIEYYVQFVDQHQGEEGHDYYQPAYNNSPSSGHGSSTNALYYDGTMTLRPIGNTSYDATKVWLDGDSDQRGEVTFTLWRYAANGISGPAQASPVQLNSVSTNPDVSMDAIEYVSITVPADSDNTVDLGQLLYDKYGDAINNLVKYDPDGYPYIYALREDTQLAGYEAVYGTVDESGKVTDTAPNYEDTNGDQVTLENVNRNDDPLIYNGGTITNRLTGTVEVQATKTWEIAAFQDSLSDVEVTFTAQSRLKGSEEEWQDTSKTLTLTGWRSETLTQTLSDTFPQYDSQGRELEYRWVETDVTLGDQATNFERNDAGGGTFTLQLTNVEGDLETLDFTSTLDEDTNTITNTFSNETDEHVDKWWQQPDGSMAQIKPADDGYPEYPNLDTTGVVEMQLFQDGNLIGTFEMDGVTDTTPTSITGLAGATYQETRSYHLDFSNLPKYDSNGVRYTYIVLEVAPNGWHTERTYDAENRLTRIDNTVGPGEGSEIRVTKDWVDGNDASHRLPVVVDLVALHDMQSQTLGDDRQPLYQYKTGDVVEEGIVLSTDNSWFVEVDVPIGGLTYRDFKLVERYLVGEDGTRYPVVTRANADTQYEGLGIDTGWINVGWDFDTTEDTSRVATPEHVYQVYATEDADPSYNEAMSAVSARNRRLGLLDLTVVKQWNDGVEHNRPEAELVLSCTEQPNVFSIDESGNVWVELDGGNRVPVTDNTGRQLNSTTDNISLEDNNLVLKVNADDAENTSEYHFFGLPKYDGSGNVVHYDVAERWVGDHDEYTSTKEVGGYVIGEQHFHDEQTITFTNTRQATRDVSFYKDWQDHYVNDELSQRPDIYLTLYRVTVTPGEGGQPQYSDPAQVPGYVHYLWDGVGEGSDPQYNQKCTIAGLPAYDSNGNEYIYYASESMSADGKALDYAPVKFDYSRVTSVHEGATEPNAVKVDTSAPNADPQENGSAYAIHENGTFVNSLTSDLEARGTKLWNNIPGNVDQADLPGITIYLQRKLSTDQNWPALTFTKQDDGSWEPGEGQVIAWTSHLEQETNNQFSYIVTHEGENGANPEDEPGTLLPRYAEDGTIYEYRAIEIPWGLYGQPGGFDNEDLGVEDGVTDDLTTFHDKDIQLGVIVIHHGETGSFLVNNTYNSAKGQLTVQKHFTGREQGDRYPNTTFDVYRYYINASGKKSEAALVATHTLTNDDLSGTGGENLVITQNGDNNANNTAQYTFTDLDIYAPDGSYWQYYVVERDIDGYTTYVGKGDLKPNATTGEGTVLSTGDTQSEDLCDATETEVTQTVLKNDNDPDVTFKNDYIPEYVSLSGTKTWDDFGNAFGLRPSAEQFKDALKVERIGNGKTDNITSEVQDNLQVTANENNTYTITLSNLEKWAPDGTAWQYRLTESLSNMTIADTGKTADDYYNATTGSSTVSANSGSSFQLANSMDGEVTVEKTWVDGNDPYGLRPSKVTVRLQARVRYADELEFAYGWTDAENLLETLGYTDLLSNLPADFSFERTLSDSNGWRASWTGLPIGGVGKASDHEGKLFVIEYRVVETKIGNQEITPPSGDSNTYTEYHPYQPSQEDSGNAQDGFSSKITNTLETTKISATKTWNDQKDAWGTRPTSGNTWSVTYFLQHKLGDTGAWEWVVEADSGADPTGSAMQDGVVSLTITGTATDGTVTWENLPQCDENGVAYEYRVVEQVPGSYDVTDGTQVTDTDTAHRYYVVTCIDDSEGNDTQSFQNDLRTVNLQGTKVWVDEGSEGIIPEFDSATKPTMALYRAVKKADGTFGAAEQVKMKDGSIPQPEWKEKDNNTWTFTYENLPAANKDNQNYVYYATEQEGSGSAAGFYPLYETSGAAGTNASETTQVGTIITNQPTRLTLDKVSDFDTDSDTAGVQGEQLANIELSVMSTDGTKTYAVWTNGVDGETYNTYTWVNGTEDATDKFNAVHRTDNLIVGLKAGSYIVRETGTVPEGYARAQDVSFTINANGTATSATDVSTSTDSEGVHTISVTATDPVLRGHLQLTKHVSDDGAYDGANAAALSGAKIDLYRVDMDGDVEDELIASGLTTNAQGIITTRNNKAEISKTASGGTFDLTYGGKYTKLSDGLPEGEYYFVETDATPGAVMPEGDAAKTATLKITQDTHYATAGAVSTTMGNEDFSAEVILHKYDTVSNDPVENAVFQLVYTPEGGGSGKQSTIKTDAQGNLTLSNLEKGSYVLTELETTGYQQSSFRATFTIDNADDDKTFDIKNISDGADIDFKVTSDGSTFTDGTGIPNVPSRGTITMAKTSSTGTALNDATFRLEVNDNGTWNTVVENLVTGQSYALNDANDGLDGTGTAGTAGQILVSNLLWGEYRFVETSPAPGYVGVTSDGSTVTSGTLTIDRTHLNASLTGNNAVRNNPTSLELNKQNDAGQALQGAEFTVTPIDGSKFADGTTGAKKLISDGTGHAVLNGQLVVGGTYEIYEAMGPTGYDPVDATFRVKVENNGDLTVVDASGKTVDLPTGWERADIVNNDTGATPPDGQADNQFSFMATNKHMAVTLTKVSSSTGNPLEGAQFTLTGKVMDDGNTTHVYTTDEKGVINITQGLMEGVDYTLTETSQPEGYIRMSEPLKFTMDERGEIVVLNGHDPATEGWIPEGWTVEGNKISLTAENDPVRLEISKIDPDGNPLFGAVFSITPAEGSSFIKGDTDPQVLRTGMDGSLSMTAWLIVGNQYDITEVSAPEGYERVTGTMRIKVEADGSLSVVGSVDADGNVTAQLAPAGYTKVADNSFKVQVTNEPIEIGLVKVDGTDSGTMLEGAEFEITGVFAGKNESETRTYTTDENGKLTLNAELKSGETYTLRETTAPAGYELLTGELSFSVAEDGTIAATGEMPEGYTIEQGNVTIVAADEPLLVSLSKVDENGEPLAGAEFRITPENGTFPDGTQEKVAISASDGSIFTDLMVTGSSEGTRYTVTEVSAPAGYEMIPAFDILVFEDGSVQLADDTSVDVRSAIQIGNAENGDPVITISDTPIEASMSKVSTNGSTLTGAAFEISGTFVDGAAPRVITFDESNSVALEGFIVGETYTLRETKAPEGYDLIEGEWTFTVQSDGTLAGDATGSVATLMTGGEAGYFVSDGGVSITAVDAPTPEEEEEGPWSFIPKTNDPTTYTFVSLLVAIAVGFIAAGLRTARRRRS